MKRCIACLFVTSLFVAVPAAGAEVIQTVDTISVVGVGRALISPSAAVPEANTAYQQALVQAAADGLLKARLLAGAAGAKVGPIEAISERGSKEIECKGAAGESASYRGVRPDSGNAEAAILAVKPTIAAPQPVIRPPVRKKRKTHKPTPHKTHSRFIARVAENVATNCELSTEVSLIYDLLIP